MTTDVIDVVICTRNRPSYLKTCVTDLLQSDFDKTILGKIYILDSSDKPTLFNNLVTDLDFISHVVQIPLQSTLSLPEKRNYFLKFYLNEERIVLFLDDDVRIHHTALSEVGKLFRSLECIGVGGIDLAYEVDKPWVFLQKILGSEISTPGRLLSSGRNIQYFSTNTISRVDWLAGNFMAFRGDCLRGNLFDESRNFIGEDVDFTFRMSQKGLLVASPDILYRHLNYTNASTIRYHRYADFIDHRTKLIHDFPKRVKFTSTLLALVLEQSLNLLGSMKQFSISNSFIELVRLLTLPFVFLQKLLQNSQMWQS